MLVWSLGKPNELLLCFIFNMHPSHFKSLLLLLSLIKYTEFGCLIWGVPLCQASLPSKAHPISTLMPSLPSGYNFESGRFEYSCLWCFLCLHSTVSHTVKFKDRLGRKFSKTIFGVCIAKPTRGSSISFPCSVHCLFQVGFNTNFQGFPPCFSSKLKYVPGG